MQYLVLGSAGLIGRSLVRFLKAHGDVIEYDIVYGCEQDLRKKSKMLEDYVRGSDFIYFLACDIGGAKYISEYQSTFEFIHNNICILKETFELLHKYSKTFIFTSSEMANISSSPYGCVKSIGEFYCKSLNSPIVKLWNIYGVEKDFNLRSHVITDFVVSAIKNNSIHVITDGEEERQFLYVDDCVRYLYAIANDYKNLKINQEIHIAGFKWYKIRDIAEIVSQKFGTAVSFGKRKDQTHLNFKFEPNNFILNYGRPLISIEEGISIIADHFKAKLNYKKNLIGSE
ncbi:MAG: SDR family oxidoreductase [Deltaproteobacteria bacterium]|nr:SDR family oxidoreductase [Deltaproteobacteria bacterium]